MCWRSLHVTVEDYPASSWMNNIPLCICTMSFLPTHLLMGFWVVAISWLLWIMLQYMWGYIYLVKILFFFLLGIYPEMKLLDHYSRSIFNFLRKLHIIFHSGWTSLHSSLTIYKGSFFTTSERTDLTSSLICPFSYLTISTSQIFPTLQSMVYLGCHQEPNMDNFVAFGRSHLLFCSQRARDMEMAWLC